PVGSPEPQALGDDRGATVGGDGERCAKGQPVVIVVDRLDALHATARDDHIGNAHVLGEVDGERAHAVDQDRVERLPRDRHRLFPIRPPRADPTILADERRAVGRGDPHSRQRAPDGVDGFERAETIEQPWHLGAQVLAADLRPREPRAVDETHGDAVLGQEDRGGGTGGPGADHDHVGGGHERTASIRPSAGYSWIVSRCAPARAASTRSSSLEYERRTDSGPSWREHGWQQKSRAGSRTRPGERRPRRRSFTTTAPAAAGVIGRRLWTAC